MRRYGPVDPREGHADRRRIRRRGSSIHLDELIGTISVSGRAWPAVPSNSNSASGSGNFRGFSVFARPSVLRSSPHARLHGPPPHGKTRWGITGLDIHKKLKKKQSKAEGLFTWGLISTPNAVHQTTGSLSFQGLGKRARECRGGAEGGGPGMRATAPPVR